MSVHFLSSPATQGVYDRLQDRDLRALGTTSQALSILVRKKLEERDQKLESLLSLYTVTQQFNVKSIKEIDLFCIGEIHNNPECDDAEIAFVAFLASRYPVVLFREGWPSMKPIRGFAQDRTLEQIDAVMDPAHVDTLYAIGWDDQALLRTLKQANSHEYNQKRTVLGEEMLTLINGTKNTLPQRWLPTSQELAELIEVCVTQEQFFDEIMETIKARGFAEMNSCSVKELESLAIVYQQYALLKKSYQAIKMEYLNRKEMAFETTFPVRTQSQTHSVQQLPQLRSDRGTPHAKAVLIAGIQHLKRKLEENSNFDLTPFYEELRKHKAAIFLPLGVETAHEVAFRLDKKEREKQKQLIEQRSRPL